MTNQILKFIKLLKQLDIKVNNFEKESYYPSPRIYGRVMSETEFRKMKARGNLSSRQHPTPVFDCPTPVKARIKSMSRDQKRIFFRAIGIRSMHRLVLFRTRLKPIIGPVPQSNGLIEFKFPKGSHVEFLEAA